MGSPPRGRVFKENDEGSHKELGILKIVSRAVKAATLKTHIIRSHQPWRGKQFPPCLLLALPLMRPPVCAGVLIGFITEE